jgi:leader peptidase (prepilin peptidase) / N-methyltransferase
MKPTATISLLGLGYGAALLLAEYAEPLPTKILLASGMLALGLISLSVVDVATFRLPNVMTVPLGLGGLAITWWLATDPWWLHLIAAAVAAVILVGIDATYKRLRGRHGLGGGDVKLFASSGAWLGLQGLPSVMLWACVTGLLLFAALWALGNNPPPRTEFPSDRP